MGCIFRCAQRGRVMLNSFKCFMELPAVLQLCMRSFSESRHHFPWRCVTTSPSGGNQRSLMTLANLSLSNLCRRTQFIIFSLMTILNGTEPILWMPETFSVQTHCLFRRHRECIWSKPNLCLPSRIQTTSSVLSH